MPANCRNHLYSDADSTATLIYPDRSPSPVAAHLYSHSHALSSALVPGSDQPWAPLLCRAERHGRTAEYVWAWLGWALLSFKFCGKGSGNVHSTAGFEDRYRHESACTRRCCRTGQINLPAGPLPPDYARAIRFDYISLLQSTPLKRVLSGTGQTAKFHSSIRKDSVVGCTARC
jgi:hypothetical protein